MLSENDSGYEPKRGSYLKVKTSEERVTWFELDSTLEDYSCLPEKDDFRKSLSSNCITIQEDSYSDELLPGIEESLRSDLDFYEEEINPNVSQDISYPYITSLSYKGELSEIYSFYRREEALERFRAAAEIKDVVSRVYRVYLRDAFIQLSANRKPKIEALLTSNLQEKLRSQAVKILNLLFRKRLKGVVDYWKAAKPKPSFNQKRDLLKKVMIERVIMRSSVRTEESAFFKWRLLYKSTNPEFDLKSLYANTCRDLEKSAESRKQRLNQMIANILGSKNRPELIKAYAASLMILMGRSNTEQRAIWKWRVLTQISSVLGKQTYRIPTHRQEVVKNLIYLSYSKQSLIRFN
jgi:hypothetical protein